LIDDLPPFRYVFRKLINQLHCGELMHEWISMGSVQHCSIILIQQKLNKKKGLDSPPFVFERFQSDLGIIKCDFGFVIENYGKNIYAYYT
jgi:hypothetical protein